MIKGTQILMVDDDPNILKFVSANLRVRGFDVTTAENGETALRIVEQAMPNLIILDLLMPGIGGAEVCRRIREWSDVPIIILTAIGESRTMMELKSLGANHYITKPFDISDFLQSVKVALEQ